MVAKKQLAWMTLALFLAAGIALVRADDPPKLAKATEQAVTYLKSTQAEDGTWGGQVAPGMTGIVLTGLLRSGKIAPDDPAAARALKYIEGLVDAKEGHIAGADRRVNYATSVNVMALTTADPEHKKYKAVIAGAGAYLKKLQWDEGEGKKPEDPVYGGAGYAGGSRSDMSNTHFFLDALKVAGIPKDDPVWKRALVYVSRCQNLKSENNDQPWAGKVNDGSFIYTAGGDTRGDPGKDGAKPGYGSMTYAGLKSLALCNVPRDDICYQKAYEWLQKNYTVEANPGMPSGSEQRGYYYYLMTMAKCLDTVGVKEITDGSGKKHDWRAEITAALLARQRKDGSWVNETNAWMEGNATLCTAYALITLSYCNPVAR